MNDWHPDIDTLEYRPDGKSYRIREAQTLRELDAVHRITHESIVSAGYMPPQRGRRIVSYPMLDPSPLTTILIAIENGAVIGTNSLTADGPLGLHTDRDFPAETDAIRREGRRLASSFRIATDPTWRTSNSTALILDIVKWSLFIAIHKYDFETMLCTFNPKHEGIYKRLLNAEVIAHLESLGHGDIQAGSVMMRIDRDRALLKCGQEMEALADRYLHGRRSAAAMDRSARADAFSDAGLPAFGWAPGSHQDQSPRIHDQGSREP